MNDFARLLPRDTQLCRRSRTAGGLLVCLLSIVSLLSDLFVKQTINLITASTADVSNLLRNNNISEENSTEIIW